MIRAGDVATCFVFPSRFSSLCQSVRDCVRTESGPGSLRGQPARGGGCDRIQPRSLINDTTMPVAFQDASMIRSLPLSVLTYCLRPRRCCEILLKLSAQVNSFRSVDLLYLP